MNAGRRVVNWFVAVVWLLTAVAGGFRAWAIFRNYSGSVPVWFVALLPMYFLSAAMWAVSAWSLLRERPSTRMWGLLQASSLLLLVILKIILFRRTGLLEWLLLGFTLEEILFWARFQSDSPADDRASDHHLA